MPGGWLHEHTNGRVHPITQEETSAGGNYAAVVEDVYEGAALDTALSSGEPDGGRNFDAKMGLPDLLGREEDSDYEDNNLEDAEDLPHVARCREPPDNPNIREDIEPPKSSPTYDPEAQQTQGESAAGEGG